MTLLFSLAEPLPPPPPGLKIRCAPPRRSFKGEYAVFSGENNVVDFKIDGWADDDEDDVCMLVES